LQRDAERFLDGGRGAAEDDGAAGEVDLDDSQARGVREGLNGLGVSGAGADEGRECGSRQRFGPAAPGTAFIDSCGLVW
jgi:hypothetical protein